MAAAEARAKALGLFPDLEPYLPDVLADVRTLQNFLDELTAAETAAAACYRKLTATADAGLDRREDYAAYLVLQNALFTAQTSALAVVRAVAGGVVTDFATLSGALPSPTLLPSLTWKGRHESQLRGLGFLPIVAAVIAALAGLGLLWLLSDEIEHMVDDLTTIYVARARAAQQTELLEARRTAYAECRARGDDDATCRASAIALAPEPTYDPGAPRGEGGPRDALTTLAWIGLGGVVVVGLLGGLYFIGRAWLSGGRRRRRAFRGYHDVPVSRVSALPSRASDLDGSRSRYNLEVRGR